MTSALLANAGESQGEDIKGSLSEQMKRRREVRTKEEKHILATKIEKNVRIYTDIGIEKKKIPSNSSACTRQMNSLPVLWGNTKGPGQTTGRMISWCRHKCLGMLRQRRAYASVAARADVCLARDSSLGLK